MPLQPTFAGKLDDFETQELGPAEEMGGSAADGAEQTGLFPAPPLPPPEPLPVEALLDALPEVPAPTFAPLERPEVPPISIDLWALLSDLWSHRVPPDVSPPPPPSFVE